MELAQQLQSLENFSLAELRRAWEQQYGTLVPAGMSPELLRISVGYELQEAVHGGLSRRTMIQISATQFDPAIRSLVKVATQRAALKPGTKFIREWHGKVHEVSVMEDRKFSYGGSTYKSLTIIARQITGTHQSGPRFFGAKTKTESMGIEGDSRG